MNRDLPEKITRMQSQALDVELDAFFGDELFISMTGRDGVKGMSIEGRLGTKKGCKLGAGAVVGVGASCPFLSKKMRRTGNLKSSCRSRRALRIKSLGSKGRKRMYGVVRAE